MKFRTIVELPVYDFKINHSDKCMFIGSCFSDNIGNKLQNTKIPTLANPTGIHYNPHSIYHSIKRIVDLCFANEEDMFFSNGLWNNYLFHSKFSAILKEQALQNINNSILYSNKFLKSCDYLFVTFGTAYVYALKENGNIVSNCHKQPVDRFEREFLEPQFIKDLWLELIEKLETFNPNLKIIFTVSPIRHWKDGAINNMYSKASLHLAIKDLLTKKTNKLHYFPAYEIVNDELRDYRFYADDMLHPSTSAVGYIWERFSDAFFSSETIELNKKIQKIVQASKHRPFNKETKEYKMFCDKNLSEIAKLQNDYPCLDFSEEILNFKS